MKCPYCPNNDTKVLDSRTLENGTVIRRRRFCEKCNNRFTTFERMELPYLAVIKQNGNREAFDRQKLLNGIIKSCNKRPVTVEQMESIALDVENTIYNSYKKEIKSSELGELVMSKLKDIDQVAYVRFASVYRQFKDVDSFMEELAKLQKEKE